MVVFFGGGRSWRGGGSRCRAPPSCQLVRGSGGGEGVMQIVHEGHVRGRGWLLVVEDGDVSWDVVPEVAQGGHPGDPCFPFPLFDVAWGGDGLGGACQARGSGCGTWCPPTLAWGARLGVALSQWGAPRLRPPWGEGSRRQGWRVGGGRVGRREGRRRRRSLGRPPPGWLPGPGRSRGCAGWCQRWGGVAPPGLRVPGGAAVPLRDCVGRRVRPVRRLVIRGVMGGWCGLGGVVVNVACGVR